MDLRGRVSRSTRTTSPSGRGEPERSRDVVRSVRRVQDAHMEQLVWTVIGPDRPGLVESLASVLARHGGSWLESRMARLSGQFAGIVQAEVPAENLEKLRAELDALARHGLVVSVGM